MTYGPQDWETQPMRSRAENETLVMELLKKTPFILLLKSSLCLHIFARLVNLRETVPLPPPPPRMLPGLPFQYQWLEGYLLLLCHTQIISFQNSTSKY